MTELFHERGVMLRRAVERGSLERVWRRSNAGIHRRTWLVRLPSCGAFAPQGADVEEMPPYDDLRLVCGDRARTVHGEVRKAFDQRQRTQDLQIDLLLRDVDSVAESANDARALRASRVAACRDVAREALVLAGTNVECVFDPPAVYVGLVQRDERKHPKVQILGPRVPACTHLDSSVDLLDEFISDGVDEGVMGWEDVAQRPGNDARGLRDAAQRQRTDTVRCDDLPRRVHDQTASFRMIDQFGHGAR